MIIHGLKIVHGRSRQVVADLLAERTRHFNPRTAVKSTVAAELPAFWRMLTSKI